MRELVEVMAQATGGSWWPRMSENYREQHREKARSALTALRDSDHSKHVGWCITHNASQIVETWLPDTCGHSEIDDCRIVEGLLLFLGVEGFTDWERVEGWDGEVWLERYPADSAPPPRSEFKVLEDEWDHLVNPPRRTIRRLEVSQ